MSVPELIDTISYNDNIYSKSMDVTGGRWYSDYTISGCIRVHVC